MHTPETQPTDLRAEFERLSEMYEFSIKKSDDGHYKYPRVRLLWLVYQSAAYTAHARAFEKAAKLCEALELGSVEHVQSNQKF